METLDKTEFWKNGFFIAKGFFDPEKIIVIQHKAKFFFKQQFVEVGLLDNISENIENEDFNQILFEFFEKFPERVVSTGKHIQHMIDLHRISLDSKIENSLKEIGQITPNICTRPVLFFNSKKLAKKDVYWKTDPHQDWRSMQGSLNSIVVWLPLIDVDKKLGALEIVPKSHFNGLQTTDFKDGFGTLPIKEVNKNEWLPIELEVGDVLFFSSFLYHRSGINSTENGIRWSCHFRYNDISEKSFIERGYPHPYVYYPNQELITPDFPTQKNIDNAFNTI